MERSSLAAATDERDALVIAADLARRARALPAAFLQELYSISAAAEFGWRQEEFAIMLAAAAQRRPEGAEAETYLRNLHLRDLALAQACALGHEAAWCVFLAEFRTRLQQAAIAITGSSSLGEELADSLYAELYGLKQNDAGRSSPLASYSGRGSLMGWLRATLAQRHVDRLRRTRHESPLAEDEDFVAPVGVAPPPEDAMLERVESAVQVCLRELDAESRFLAAAYFLDGRTLVQIARLLRVHEATVSRKLKRLSADVRKRLLRRLQSQGLSRAAAEEALSIDPRDLNLDLRKILQHSTGPPFLEKTESRKPPATPGNTQRP